MAEALLTAVTMRRLSDVQPEATQWLWRGYIPLGELTLLGGDPKLGKSNITLDLAARTSTGRTMPDQSRGQFGSVPKGVVLLTHEDSLARTIRPRLDAAGADCTRIAQLYHARDPITREWRFPTLEDLTAIEASMLSMDAGLLVIDPMDAYVPERTTTASSHRMRRLLMPLAEFAQRNGSVGVIAVMHLNKRSGEAAAANVSALYRLAGSSGGIGGVARSILIVARDKHDENRRVLAPLDGNLCKKPPSLLYTLEDAGADVSRVQWGGTTELQADDLLNTGTEEPGEGERITEAVAFLQAYLQDGAKPAGALINAAHAAGIRERTLRRAADKLHVEKRKTSGPWEWALPTMGTTH
jgi:hypothetical protein